MWVHYAAILNYSFLHLLFCEAGWPKALLAACAKIYRYLGSADELSTTVQYSESLCNTILVPCSDIIGHCAMYCQP